MKKSFLTIVFVQLLLTACAAEDGDTVGALFIPPIFEAFPTICDDIYNPYQISGPSSGNSDKALLLDDSSNIHPWSDDLPNAWWPESVEEVDIVICVNDQELIIQTCSYIGYSSIERIQRMVDVVLVDARTGNRIDNEFFFGSEPRNCGRTESIGTERLIGGPVDFDEVMNWLELYLPSSAEQARNRL